MSDVKQEDLSVIGDSHLTSPPKAKQHGTIWAIVYCCIAAAVFFRGPLFFPRMWHIPYDIDGFHYPLSCLIAWSLRTFHQLPWWNPFTYMGQPFAGNVQAAMFYPPTIFTVLTGNLLFGHLPYYWFELQLILHVALAGVGTYLLLRALQLSWWPCLAGATMYELGAFFASQTQHLGAVSAAAWLPWFIAALYLLEQRRDLRSTAFVAFGFALMILPGFPAEFLPALVFAPVLYGLWMWQRNPVAQWDVHRRPVALLAIALALGMLISAVSWLPGSQVAHNSIARYRPTVQGLTGFPLEALTSFVWPNLFNQLHGFAWLEVNRTFLYLYESIPGLLLLGFGLRWLLRSKRARPFLICAGLGFLWMFGQFLFVAEFLYLAFTHFVRKAIYPEHVLAYFSLFFSVVAAMALEGFVNGDRESPYSTSLCWRGSLGAMVLAMLLLVTAPLGATVPNFVNRANSSATALLLIAVMFAASGLLMAWQRSSASQRSRVRFAAGVCALIFLDLVTFGSQTDLNTYQGVSEDPPVAKFLKQRVTKDASYRLDFSSLRVPWLSWSTSWRTPSANGMDPLLLLDTVRYRSPFSTLVDRVFSLTDPNSPLLDLASVRYIVTPPQENLAGKTLIYHNEVNVFENPQALPRFFLVGAVQGATATDAVWMIQKGRVDPSKVALIDQADKKFFPQPSDPESVSQPGSVQLLSYTPNELRLKVLASESAVLVATETFWPEWHASIDGTEVQLVRVDGLFRAISVPSGPHEIRMWIRPRSVYIGGTISLLAFLLSCAFTGGGSRLLRSRFAKTI